MRTHFPRQSATTRRQEVEAANDEAEFQDRAAELLGIAEENGDRAQDEAAIESAPCFQVGVGENGFAIYRANSVLLCINCVSKIAREALFSSRWATRPELYCYCANCKPIVFVVPDSPELAARIARGR